jgi:hypothetical protein
VYVTTFSYGMLEFQCQHQNGVDIFMAFLKASVPPERVLDRAGRDERRGGLGGGSRDSYDSATTASDDGEDGAGNAGSQRRKGRAGRARRGEGSRRGDNGPTIRSSSSVTSCLDVDAFTAAHLRGRAEHETWPEKVTRRVGHVVNSLSDLSAACCDGSWCGGLLQPPAAEQDGGEGPSRPASFRRQPSVVDDDDRDDHPPAPPPSRRKEGSTGPTPPPPTSSSALPGASGRPSQQDGGNRATATGDPASCSTSNRPLGYSDLELDEHDSQLPGAGDAAAGGSHLAGEHNRPPPSPSSTSSSPRRYNSVPNARRLELSRNTSC